MNKLSRFFIVGSPRSGTTLLQSQLVKEYNIISFPETHFFYEMRNSNKILHFLQRSNSEKVNQKLISLKDKLNINQFVINEKELSDYKGSVKVFLELLDFVAIQNNYNTWLEKTPIHLHFIKYIEKVDPNVHFIHIIRKGQDVISSVLEVTKLHSKDWGGSRSLEEITSRYIFDVEQSKKHLGKDNHTFVLFDEFIKTPNKLWDRLDQKTSLQRRQNKGFDIELTNIIEPNELWKTKSLGDIVNVQSKVKEILSLDEIEFVNFRLRKIDYNDFQ
jgi:hypothetical protein